jgi:hypothetical protein
MEMPLTLTRREVVASTTGPLVRPNPHARDGRHPTHHATDRTHRKARAC